MKTNFVNKKIVISKTEKEIFVPIDFVVRLEMLVEENQQVLVINKEMD